MDRVTLTDTLSLSRIVYGMWRLSEDRDTSAGHVQAKVEACLEQGITSMDQADIYGGYEAEALLGAAFKAAPGLRDKCEIVTKCDIVAPAGRHADARVKHYDTSRAHVTQSVEDSLRLMAIDRIDLLLIHRPDPLMDHHETGRALDDLVASGKVGAVGVSNFRPWDWSLLQSAMQTPLVTNQIEISLNRLEPFTNGDLAFLQEKGVPPMAWSPLGGGSLMSGESDQKGLRPTLARVAKEQNVDIAAVAVAWLLAHPSKILPVMGTNTLSRIATLGDALKVEMDRQAWFELYTHALGHEVP
ncbi:aldo/keto reductase [Tranquillimonas rosea]|uniref:aldo/keto reductase n=1 Tax=Tranquillimonas rosea TaxID=641238 RepID=UPI003BA99FEE